MLNKQGIYIELDCLLDTRLTIIRNMDEELATRILYDGSYHNRTTDRIEGLDYDEFTKQYDARDIDVVSNSLMTNLLSLVKEQVGMLEIRGIKDNIPMRYEVSINTHPYNISAEEIKEIANCIEVALPLPTTVKMIKVNPQDLTPTHCKSNYAMMYMYEYYKWIDIFAKHFETVRLPEVELFGPAIRFSAELSDEDKATIVKQKIDPMKAWVLYMSPAIKIELIPPEYFSIISLPSE